VLAAVSGIERRRVAIEHWRRSLEFVGIGFVDLFLHLISGCLLEDREQMIFLLSVVDGHSSARCEKSETANQ